MLLQIFLLVFVLCLDTFVASIAYGTNQVRISHGQIALFNGICCLSLGLSLFLGAFISSRVPDALAKSICFYSLFFLGCFRLADAGIRQYLKRHRTIHKNASFHFSHLRLIIDICSDPMEADADRNFALSWKEVLFFSLAMSVDSLLTGMLAAFLNIPVAATLLCAFLVGEAFTYLGLFCGQKISSRCPKDLSWLGGVLLILLAVLKSRSLF